MIKPPLSEKLVKGLVAFGLTENEAKTYLAILQLKRATARATARLSGIPRQEIYRVMPKLEKLGIVQVVVAKPAQFVAMSPSKVLTELIEHQREVLHRKISELEEKKASLENELFKVEGKSAGMLKSEPLHFVLISGRRQVNEKFEEMLENAKKTVLWTSPRLEVKRAVIYDRDDMLRRCSRRGVEIRILSEVDADNIEEVRELSRFCEIRHVPGIASLMTIVDDRELMVGSAVHSSDDELIHELWTNDRDYIETMKEFFERIWTDSKPAASQIESIDGEK